MSDIIILSNDFFEVLGVFFISIVCNFVKIALCHSFT